MYAALCSYNYVTDLRKTNANHTIGILRITTLKYLTHCESLVLSCIHAKFTVLLQELISYIVLYNY